MRIVSVQAGTELGVLAQDVIELTPNDALQLCDNFTAQQVQNLIQQKGNPGFVFATSHSRFHIPGIKVNCVPLTLELCSWGPWPATPGVSTTSCFNFSINTKNLNRYLTLRLVEWFGFRHFDYTYSGFGREYDMQYVLKEWHLLDPAWATPKLRSFLLSPVMLPTQWITVTVPQHLMRSPDSVIDQALQAQSGYLNFAPSDGQGGYRTVYDHAFGNKFESSAVSLITESSHYLSPGERCAIWTEKSIFPVLALTMPIWIGGYGAAEDWQRMGFDVFDDIIDHSYQFCATLTERCYRAIADNCEILQDLDLARAVRQQVMPRLIKNRELMLQGQFRKYNDQLLQQWSSDVLSDLLPIIEHGFRYQGGQLFARGQQTPALMVDKDNDL